MKRLVLVASVFAVGCINFGDEFALNGANLPSRDAGNQGGGVGATGGGSATGGGTATGGGATGGGATGGGGGGGAQVDAGFCSALGCFGPTLVIPSATSLTTAVLNQPSNVLVLGHARGASWYVSIDAGAAVDVGSLVIGADLDAVNGSLEGPNGDFFTLGTKIAHVGPGGSMSTLACAGSDTFNSWRGIAAGLDGDAWFFRRTDELCHWRADAGFERETLPDSYGTSSTLVGGVVFPDGGMWVLTSERLVFTREGTRVDTGGFEFDGITRIEDSVFGWAYSSSTDGLYELTPGGVWTQVSILGIAGVWGERANDVWALADRLTGQSPILVHGTDAGWVAHNRAALYPPDLPSNGLLFAISGRGPRLVLTGTVDQGTSGLVLELTPK